MRPRRVELAIWLVLALSALPWLIFWWQPQSAAAAGLAEPQMTALACLAKLLFLAVASWYAWGNRCDFEAGNPARSAWALLGLGLFAYLLGQLGLSPWQLTLREAPFPGLGDAFFVLGYPLLLAALVTFLRAYAVAGLPLPSGRTLVLQAAVLSLLLALVAVPVIRPILSTQAQPLERLLNVFYPAADFVLLVPTLLLTRTSLALRGGRLARMWLALLGGFGFTCLGDIAFGYLSGLGMQHLDPLLHVMFLLGYAAFALASMFQRELAAT